MAPDLTDDFVFDADDKALFDRVSQDRRVMVPLAELGDDVGPSVARLADADLVRLAEWDGAPVVTLSPLAAAKLGLCVAETSAGYEWAAAPSQAPHRPRPRRRETVDLDSLPDARALTPDEIAEARETVDAASGGVFDRLDSLPRPWVLLSGCQQWSGHGDPEHVPSDCPACLNRPLRPTWYCLYCYRWGLDAVRNRLLASIRAKLAASRSNRRKAAFRPAGSKAQTSPDGRRVAKKQRRQIAKNLSSAY